MRFMNIFFDDDEEEENFRFLKQHSSESTCMTEKNFN